MRALRALPIVVPLLAGCVAVVDSDHKVTTTGTTSSSDVTGTAGTTSTGDTNGTTGATGGTGQASSAGSGGSNLVGMGSASTSTTSGSGGGDVEDSGTSSGGGSGSGGGAGSAGGKSGAGGTIVDAGARDVTTSVPDGAQGDPEPGALKGITRAHDAARAMVGVPAITWDPTIAMTAQAYAAKCVFVHSMAPGLGENLSAFAPSGGRTGSAPVDDWVAEKANYDYASNTCAAGKVCGHYTQVVWKNSSRLGCGVQACSVNSPFMGFPNWEIWVCNYAPQGNFNGQRPY